MDMNCSLRSHRFIRTYTFFDVTPRLVNENPFADEGLTVLTGQTDSDD